MGTNMTVTSMVVVDRAQDLRPTHRHHPVRAIAVTSGKGGVGKTNVSVNLATEFARLGKQVMLMDGDMGLANVDVLLGLHPVYDLRHVISGERTLEEVIITSPAGVRMIPGSSGVAGMSQLGHAQQAGLIQAFSELICPTDILIVDTAAGITDNITTFAKAVQEVIVVVCDEPGSISSAYALIRVLSRDHGLKRFHVLANMVRNDAHGDDLFEKIARMADHFLGIRLEYLGAVPFDECLRKAVQRQIPVVELFPRSEATLALREIVKRIDKWPLPQGPSGNVEFFVERLIELGRRGD